MRKPTLLERRTIYESKILNVVEEQFEHVESGSFQRVKVEHPGAAVILPKKDQDTLLLVSQYRASIDQEILEFPAGTLEPKESPLNCAMREIVEEVGYSAQTWTELGIAYPAPGFCDEKQFFFYATDLTSAEMALEEDELIEVVEMSIDEVEAAIASNTIVDTKSICIFYRAKLMKLL